MGPWMMNGPMYMDGWAWLWMTAAWLLPIVLVVAAMYLFTRGGDRRRADEILAERFARGEIDESELRSRRAVLRSR